MPKSSISDQDIRQLRYKYQHGTSIAQLAREYGLSYMGADNLAKMRTRKDVGVAKGPPSIVALNKDLYGIWKMMHVRCTNPSHVAYKDYGGRGIKVCERWNSFELFLADMSPRPSKEHTMDRIDSDGNYTPENTRWATHANQSRNKRASWFLPHPITGEYIPAAEVAEIMGIPYQAMRYRLQKINAWSPVTRAEADKRNQLQSSSPPLSTEVQEA